MANMNSKTRKRLYQILSARDGEFCARCGIVGSFKTLCIDHVDNNNSNNDLDNLQLLCRSCNTKKNPRGKAKPENRSYEFEILNQSEELRLKKKYTRKFLPWLEWQIKRYGRVLVKEIIYSGAKISGASIKTITDYLNVECSAAGKYQVVEVDGKRYVEFKEWFK
jgi:HNH endonuclease